MLLLVVEMADNHLVHTAVLLGLISSLILTVVGVLFTPTLLRWMDTDPEVLPDAIAYFRCYFAGVGAGVMYNTFTGIMNALGDRSARCTS